MSEEYQRLTSLLEARLEVIADHDFRDRDPEAHLKKLQEVSESITAFEKEFEPELPPRLAHFLTNCSYDKALAWLKEQG